MTWVEWTASTATILAAFIAVVAMNKARRYCQEAELNAAAAMNAANRATAAALRTMPIRIKFNEAGGVEFDEANWKRFAALLEWDDEEVEDDE